MDLLGYTSLSSFSTSDLVVGFVLAVIFAFIGYRSSHRFRLVVGVTPWRIPSIVWAAICFFLQPFGVILQWVAEFTTRPGLGGSNPPLAGQQPRMMGSRRGAMPPGPYPQGGYAPPPAPNNYPAPPAQPSAAYPMYPQQSHHEQAPTDVAPPPPPGFAPPLDAQGRPAIFGWYADPTRRHEQRYWDGRGWGDLVADAGVRSNDPIAP